MLTPDQIKNLKKGDKLVHEIRFIEEDGDYIKCSFSPLHSCDKATFFIGRSCLSLPTDSQSKYSPCRLFKKGDIVRLKEWNSRLPTLPEEWKVDNGLFKVNEDERFKPTVEITRENLKDVYIAPICFLELVTPVEELEPYSVVDAHTHWDVADKDMKTVATYSKGFHPNAKAAAEDERDLLNAEYRKKYENEN